MEFRPLHFFLTGLAWLVLASLLGLGLLYSTVLGAPLPSFLRLLHVHGALVGGVAQIILGAMVSFVPTMLMTNRERSESHPILYATINVGTIGMLLGFGTQYVAITAIAGLLVVGAFLSLFGQGIKHAQSSLISPPLNVWFYGVAVLLLLVGLGVGEGMAFRLFEPMSIGKARLAHIHFNLIGFVTLTIIGTMHNLFPTILSVPLHSPRLARLTFFLVPPGVLLLLAGFMLTNLWVQIAAGALLITGVLLYAYNITRTWVAAGSPRNIAADHLMMATIFLALAVIAGLLVSVNALWDPPRVPLGTLHVVAYAHLALVGFTFQTILGALSHLLPINLALVREPSNKKRGPYLEELSEIAGRWAWLQVGSLNVGTLGLSVIAALVWVYPLGSVIVKATTWGTITLLTVSVALFATKVVLLLGRHPQD